MNHAMGIPTLHPPTEEKLTEVEQWVQRRLHGRVRQFHLSLYGAGLVLTGRTCTYYVKQLAQHAVMEFVDLPILANDIEVV